MSNLFVAWAIDQAIDNAMEKAENLKLSTFRKPSNSSHDVFHDVFQTIL